MMPDGIEEPVKRYRIGFRLRVDVARDSCGPIADSPGILAIESRSIKIIADTVPPVDRNRVGSAVIKNVAGHPLAHGVRAVGCAPEPSCRSENHRGDEASDGVEQHPRVRRGIRTP